MGGTTASVARNRRWRAVDFVPKGAQNYRASRTSVTSLNLEVQWRLCHKVQLCHSSQFWFSSPVTQGSAGQQAGYSSTFWPHGFEKENRAKETEGKCSCCWASSDVHGDVSLSVCAKPGLSCPAAIPATPCSPASCPPSAVAGRLPAKTLQASAPPLRARRTARKAPTGRPRSRSARRSQPGRENPTPPSSTPCSASSTGSSSQPQRCDGRRQGLGLYVKNVRRRLRKAVNSRKAPGRNSAQFSKLDSAALRWRDASWSTAGDGERVGQRSSLPALCAATVTLVAFAGATSGGLTCEQARFDGRRGI